MRKVFIVLVLLMKTFSFAYGGPENVKEPNVSGQFYSDDPQELAKDIEAHFFLAPEAAPGKKLSLIIAPHAGYLYSGSVAAYSFKAASLGQYKTVVVIGPSHFFGFEGVAVWDKGSFKTPLGTIPIDEEFSAQLVAANKRFYFEPQAFAREHSVEVELPFLQKTFTDFKIVPIVMGQPHLEDCKALAAALNSIIGGREDVLVVISSDMSHYHPDAVARAMDQATLAAIKDMKTDFFWNQCLLGKMEMCGFIPVTTALFYAKERGLTDVEILKYANSGDVTGDKSGVVGYSAVAFYPGESGANLSMSKEAALTVEQKKRLFEIATETVKTYVSTGKVPDVKESDPRLAKEEGAFVTLHKNGQLRGCIGHIIGDQPLYLTVRDMAVAAASDDPRFPPVTKDELKNIDLEISVLSQPERITDTGLIKMGVHGVIVGQDAYHRGVFLPQVATETGWSKEEFLSQLCSQKAGLPPDAWKDPRTVIEIFTADVFSQKDLK